MTFHTRRSTMKDHVWGWLADDPHRSGNRASFIEISHVGRGPAASSGRVGSGIGAAACQHAGYMEQIDGDRESLSIDSFKFSSVVPRVVACVIALPILTVFMDFSLVSPRRISLRVRRVQNFTSAFPIIVRAFAEMAWSNFIPPTLKTAVFGFIIGTVSAFFGYTTNKGAKGVGEAVTTNKRGGVFPVLIILGPTSC